MTALQITMTVTEAQQVTERIKLLVQTVANQTEKIADLVQQAHDGNAWSSLGYPSWTAYLAGEFSGAFSELERAAKSDAIKLLSTEGMSTRAIAAVVGVGKSTVERDLQEQVSHRGTPAKTVVGTDGKTYARPATFLPSGRPDARSAREMGESVPAPARRANRRPLPDAYWNAVYDLEKAVERLERLHADDRFAANQQALVDRNFNRMGDLGTRLQSLSRHLCGTDSEIGEYRERGKAKFLPGGDCDD